MFAMSPVHTEDNLFHARVDSLWAGDRLAQAKVVVDAFHVVEKRKGFYVINKPFVNGQTKILVGSPQDAELKRNRKEAVLSLYQKMIRRIALVVSHPDVLNGKVSEGAAILEGLV